MKRRVFTLLLAMVMMLGMIPVTASAASAEPGRKVSDSCVSLIKYFEGFRAKPYWDYSQYTVGYGTRCPDDKLDEYLTYGISVAEAEKLLRKELASFEKSVNDFDAANGLNLTQYQFDALVSFTYNLGASWMRGDDKQLLKKAVLENQIENDFLFAMGLWSNAGGSVSLGLVNRRLVEANLYLNGVYSTSAPKNYGYVMFDHATCVYQGVDRSVRLQAFDASRGDVVRPVAKKAGYRFLGWYTASKGGEWVDYLTADLSGKTLYAHWQSNEGNVAADGSILGTAASYQRTAAEELNIYAQPVSGASVVGTVGNGTVMSITADYVDATGVKWGRISRGWVCLSGTDAGADTDAGNSDTQAPEEEKIIATGVITASSLKIRAGAGTGYAQIGLLKNGEKVDIFEMVTVSGTTWGRMSQGWVSMDYVKTEEVKEEIPAPTEPETTVPPTTEPETTVPPTTVPPTEPETEPATEPETKPVPTEPAKDKVIATGSVKLSSGNLSIRSAAGTDARKVGSLKNGEKVEILEMVTVSGTKWGRISDGWICMTYVKLDSTATESEKTMTGTITASSLNVRSGAGTGYAAVATYVKGDKVTVYETATVGSVTWGRTEKGWISMQYVKLSASSGKEETVPETKPETTVPPTTVPPATEPATQPETKPVAKPETNSTRTGVTTSDLNVRKVPGTNQAKVTCLKKGNTVNILEIRLVDNTPWGKISNGWICLDYVKLSGITAGSSAMIKGTSLRVRAGAGTGYAVVGTYDKGDQVVILETRTVSGAIWGRTEKGWISLDYVL